MSKKRTAAPVLFLSFGAAAASFLLGTGYTQLTAHGIVASVRGIVEDAVPSVEELSEARYALTQLQTRVQLPGPRDGQRWAEIGTALLAIEERFRRYQSFPMYPGERALESVALHRLAELRRIVDAARSAGRESDHATEVEIARASESVDLALSDLLNFNVGYARTYAQEADHLRRRTMTVALSLDAVSAALTLVAALIAWRVIRERERLDEERMAELEQFAGRVAHDLRNPLSTIGLSASLVESDAATQTEELQEALGRIQRSLARGNQTIDALLQFARAGARPDPSATAHVAAAVEGACEDAAEQARQSQVELVIEVEPDLLVACESGALTSVLTNLVQNAIKFMGDAAVRRVTVRAVRSRDVARVDVHDTGPGLPPGYEEVVFQPFTRVPDSTQPGIGLGLATVKRLVEAHGGKVGVTSRERGCRFWVELPLA